MNTHETARLLKVEAREGYRIWVAYDDGESGEVDLSHNAGKGVFKAWDDREFFEQVSVTESGAIGWGGGLDICADAVYLRLTGRTVEEIWPGLRRQSVDV